MTRHLLAAIAFNVALAVAMLPGISSAQYYVYPPYYYSPTAPPPAASPPNQGPGNPFRLRMAPDPRVYWQWDHQIRIWDFQETQRSPLNPETPLDYMLRTF